MAVTVAGAIIERLKANTDVTDYLSTFNFSPAIFANVAPQEAERTYIVLDAQKNEAETGNLPWDIFLIDIDIYYDGISALDVERLTLNIEFSLDRAVLNSDTYKTIRIYRESNGYVEKNDIRVGHYNQQFTIRAARWAWMQQL